MKTRQRLSAFLLLFRLFTMVLHFYLKKNFQNLLPKPHKNLTRRFVIQSHFAAKHFAFCCKTHCDLRQNATLTAAKRNANCCKTQG